jgi:hypothetical protein
MVTADVLSVLGVRHQQQAKEELLNSIKQDMEDTKWFDELWEAIEND